MSSTKGLSCGVQEIENRTTNLDIIDLFNQKWRTNLIAGFLFGSSVKVQQTDFHGLKPMYNSFVICRLHRKRICDMEGDIPLKTGLLAKL